MLLEMSLAGALLVIAIILIRALVMHKLPKSTFLILWAIVLARLLVPISIPSQVSVFNLGNILNSRAAESHIPEIYETLPTRLPVPTFQWQFQRYTTASTGTTNMANTTESYTGRSTIGLPAIQPATLVYFVGVILSIVFFTVLYFKHRKEFMMSLPVNNSFTMQWLNTHKLKRRIIIRVSDKIATPLTYGILRPVILLPKDTDWTNVSQLEYILAHEYIHIRRFDTLTKILMTAALCIHWFNPILWAMYFLFNRDMEITCDEAVIRMFGETSKRGYALTLISMVERRSYLPVMYNNFSRHAIEERITAIMKIKKATIIGTLLALVLIVTTAAVFATTGVGDSPVPINSASSGSQNNNLSDNPDIPAAQSQSQIDSFNIEIGEFFEGEPGDDVITAVEAAQIGAYVLETLFGADLDGVTINMQFSQRVEAGSERGNMVDWSTSLVNGWAEQLGMTVDEILDYVRAASIRDYNFEIGLNVDSLATVVGLTSEEFMAQVMTVYIANRSVVVVEGWASQLGITADELFELMFNSYEGSEFIGIADTLGVPMEEFGFLLGNVWNTTRSTAYRAEQPSMWHGHIILNDAIFSQYHFAINAETGKLMNANYNPWAVYTEGMLLEEARFGFSSIYAVPVDVTAQHNNKYARLAMDIAQEFGIMSGTVVRATISAVSQGANPATGEAAVTIMVDVECATGEIMVLGFDGFLEDTPVLTIVSVGGRFSFVESEFDWVTR